MNCNVKLMKLPLTMESFECKVTGSPTNCPQISYHDNLKDKKKEQLKALIEKMKQDGKSIDWATAVLC